MKIVAVAGSLRANSYNRSLLKEAISVAQSAGAEVVHVDLREYPLPIFNQDEEEKNFPENAKKLKAIFKDAQGWLIASPEYNSSITAVLKNTLDWISRTETDDEKSLAVFEKKVAVIMSASPGALGGLRGLVHLRAILGNVGVIVLPEQKAIPQAHEVFDQDGRIKNEKLRTQVGDLAKGLVQFLKSTESYCLAS
jgi:chromate reductase